MPKEDWNEPLPDELLRRSRRVGNEFAWRDIDAVDVIDLLTAAGWVVLGVDTWTFRPPDSLQPTVLGPDWDAAEGSMSPTQFITSSKDCLGHGVLSSLEDVWFNITALPSAETQP